MARQLTAEKDSATFHYDIAREDLHRLGISAPHSAIVAWKSAVVTCFWNTDGDDALHSTVVKAFRNARQFADSLESRSIGKPLTTLKAASPLGKTGSLKRPLPPTSTLPPKTFKSPRLALLAGIPTGPAALTRITSQLSSASSRLSHASDSASPSTKSPGDAEGFELNKRPRIDRRRYHPPVLASPLSPSSTYTLRSAASPATPSKTQLEPLSPTAALPPAAPFRSRRAAPFALPPKPPAPNAPNAPNAPDKRGEPPQDTTAATHELEAVRRRTAALNVREVLLNAREVSLNSREASLNSHEASLNSREASLSSREASLTARGASLNAREVAQSALSDEVSVLRARIAQEAAARGAAERAVQEERARRARAEGVLADVRRECSAPFVVPALLDAFVRLAEASGDALAAVEEERERRSRGASGG
ncbi:hypothetical protein WOLCODRAFT_158426 [Wolfiporia cocos MD-104 SS10]|uniref:Uncharacterized protein n=1 Tax=Wolfiporia cocos (strain MD-104) TaxID=742152 RepID=A0A2H3JBD1_WOLCO|nr:hypothetical protein WOLCODRAFT_158426 [Wolfiporia cocos MD-104 SS10]